MEKSEYKDFLEMGPQLRYSHCGEVLVRRPNKVVYRGFDGNLGIEVEWHQFYVDNMSSRREVDQMKVEVEMLQTLCHKNVIGCKHFWTDEDIKNIYIITEAFPFGSLKHYCKLHAKYVTISMVKRWARQILDGLVYLHTQSPLIIHRNLKCDHIFINGNTGEVKIGDMGFSTTMRDGKPDTLVGTLEFFAPEMFHGSYDEKVDVYAFGMCVLEMVTGEYPYKECKTLGEVSMKAFAGKEPKVLKNMKDLEVQSFIRKCLTQNPLQRPSAIDLLQDPFLNI